MSYGEACFNEGYEQGLDRGRQESKQLRAAARLAYEALDGILSEFHTSGDDGAPPADIVEAYQALMVALGLERSPETEPDYSELPL